MILVVDDDKRVVATLDMALARAGYLVVRAKDGVEAYGHVKSPACECMLLDVQMPRINGVELLLIMQGEGIHVPTIVMAGFEDFEKEEMKGLPNVVEFFSKPFELADMLAAVRRWTDGRWRTGFPAASLPMSIRQ